MQRSAHTVKGSLRLFGTSSAMTTASELEEMGANSQFENGRAKLRILEAQIEQLRPQLVAFAEGE